MSYQYQTSPPGSQPAPLDWCPLRIVAVLMILAGIAVLVWRP